VRFVATKTAEQLDLQALHRVRSRLVSERTAIANEIRAFLLDRGIAVAQGLHRLRVALPEILAMRTDLLAPRLLHILEDLIGDWRAWMSASAAFPLRSGCLLSRTLPVSA
jgi:transposase